MFLYVLTLHIYIMLCVYVLWSFNKSCNFLAVLTQMLRGPVKAGW